MEYITLSAALAAVVLLVFALLKISALSRSGMQAQLIKETKRDLEQQIQVSRQETLQLVQSSVKALGEMLAVNQRGSAEAQDKRLAEMNRQFASMTIQNEHKMEQIRQTMEGRLAALTADNNRQLEQMRHTVDEKLQKTLETRISQSFKLVSERLEQVYKGLGEMDAGQLWETTMDPSRRTLLRVTINDMEMYHETCQTFSILMGDEVEPRKNFILEHAQYISMLDI